MDAAQLAEGMGISPGDLIAGRYRVVRVIGHGGMGLIVEATHEALGQRVALKFLRPQGEAEGDATVRFLAEAQALGHLKSMHFPRVTDIARLEDGTPYFVMEYLEGHDLGAALEVDGPLSVVKTVDVALQVCEALAEAYTEGIVHRDIKPANLFLTRGLDGSPLVKVLDLGISKVLQDGLGPDVGMTHTRAVMGSPRYMAPEQMRSSRRVDHRADIWSLGVVMHESLTGHPPFVGDTLTEVCAAIAADDPVRVRQLRRDVPIELQDIILRCLAKNPDKRYRDVAELAADLVPFGTPDGAGTARRIARIVHGPSKDEKLSQRPPIALTSVPPASGIERSRDRSDGPVSSPPPSLAPPPEPAPAPSRLPRWAFLILAVVAIPAFIVGALVQSSPAPAPPPAPSPTPAGDVAPRTDARGTDLMR